MPFGIGTRREAGDRGNVTSMTGRNKTFFRFVNLSERIWISPIMLLNACRS